MITIITTHYFKGKYNLYYIIRFVFVYIQRTLPERYLILTLQRCYTITVMIYYVHTHKTA